MNSAAAIAQAALSELHTATANYHYDTAGLRSDIEIVEFAHQWIEDHKPAPVVTDDDYFAALRDGEGRFAAARKLGMDPVLILRRMRADKDFVDRITVAEMESLEPAYQKLREKAISADGDIRALTKLLEAKNPGEFAAAPKTQVNVQVNNGGIKSDDPIDAQIMELRSDLMQKRELQTGIVADIEIPYEETDG